MRLIDADELKIEMKKQIDYFEDRSNCQSDTQEALRYLNTSNGLKLAINDIDNAPTVRLEYLPNYANCESVEMVRVSRPQGEWIAVSSMIDKDIHIICSNCKEEFIGKSTLEEWKKEYLFCHRCGAKMSNI